MYVQFVFVIFLPLSFQIKVNANPPFRGGWAIILLSWKGMMVTPSTLRGRVTISFSLNKDMYSGYFVYLSYICNAYQIEGIYLHLPFQNEGHAQNLLSIEGGPSSSSVGKA